MMHQDYEFPSIEQYLSISIHNKSISIPISISILKIDVPCFSSFLSYSSLYVHLLIVDNEDNKIQPRF